MAKEGALTVRQRKWLKVYLETGNATEAAVQSYTCHTRESAASIGWENLRKLDFSGVMEETGISIVHLLSKLKEGLESKRVISARITSSEAGIDTNDFIEVPDYQTRFRYLELALKLKKLLPITAIPFSPEIPTGALHIYKPVKNTE